MDELTSRQMPHSVEAEQSVLGSMLIDSRCIAEVVGTLRPDDFYIDSNRSIFETIYSMFNYSMTIDPVTVMEQMKIDGTYRDSISEYLLKLMEVTPTAANVMEYAAIVKDKSLLRSRRCFPAPGFPGSALQCQDGFPVLPVIRSRRFL